MPKICFILGTYWSYTKGGSEYQAKILIDYLQNKGYRIVGIYAGDKCAKVNVDGVEVYSLRRPKLLSKLGSPFSLDSLKMISILNNIQPDVIYQRIGSAYTGIAAYYARKNNCRMIWHIASEIDVKPFQFGWKKAIRPFNYLDKKFLEYGIKNADYIIGQAEYQNGLLRENYGRECDLIVPNFHPMPKYEIRKKAPVKVVWVANFKKLKQPEVFIKLAKEFKDYKNVKFIMIGRPGQKNWQAKLENRIDKLNNLEYLGERPNNYVNRILCESHIFVNTSAYEGFPNTFIQAWMRRVPVVSLNVDPDGVIEHNKIGFHSRSFEKLVSHTRQLIENKRLREQMGKRAYEFAVRAHSLDANIEKMIKLFGG